MGKTYEQLGARQRDFIAAQKIFFVATAPLADEGHVNLSPKGIDDTFAVIDEHTVAYLDFVGSGAETIAHARENGRICLMFCAFDGPPLILRIHGRAQAVLPGDDRFAQLRPRFGDYGGVRAIIVVTATRISDSCGYGVPVYEFLGHRDQLLRWQERVGEAEVAAYRREHNATSLDGLPAIDPSG